MVFGDINQMRPQRETVVDVRARLFTLREHKHKKAYASKPHKKPNLCGVAQVSICSQKMRTLI